MSIKKIHRLDIVLIIMMLAFSFYVFIFAECEVNSDGVFGAMIADGIMTDKLTFLKNYVSQHSIMPLHVLYYIPQLIVRLFTSDLLLVMKLGYIGNVALLCGSIIYFTKVCLGDTSYRMVIPFILAGMGSTFFIKLQWYDPFYTDITIFSLIIFGMVVKNIEHLKKTTILITSLLIIYTCSIDIRAGSSFCLPMLCAVVLYFVIENWNASKESVNAHLRKIIFVCTYIVLSSVLAIVLRKFLTNYVFDVIERFASGDTFLFAKPEDIALNIGSLIIETVSLFGQEISGERILSIYGIMWFISAFIAFVVMFFVPIILLKKYSKLSLNVKIFLLFYLCNYIVNFLILALSSHMIFYRTGWNGSHYFLVCQIEALILTGYYLSNFWDKSKYLKLIFLYIILAWYLFQCIFLTISLGINGWSKKEKNNELYSAIESEGYDYGYGTYWNGVVNTILSGGKIKIRAISVVNAGIIPFYDHTSRDWYRTGKNEEKTFLILSDEEEKTIDFEKNQLNNYLYVKNVDDYKIYFYNYDVVEHFAQISLSVDEKRSILNYLNVVQGNVEKKNEINIPWGGIVDYSMYNPEKGVYRLIIDVENENRNINSAICVVEKYRKDKMISDEIELKNGRNEIQIQLNKPQDAVRFYVWNKGEEQRSIDIKNVELERIE